MDSNKNRFKEGDRIILINDLKYKNYGIKSGMHGTIVDEMELGVWGVQFDGKLFHDLDNSSDGFDHYGSNEIFEYIDTDDLELEDSNYILPEEYKMLYKKINGVLIKPDDLS